MSHLQSGFTTYVQINGEEVGPFRNMTGGDPRSEVTADRAPGQKYASQTPGLPTLEPITVTRTFDPAADTPARLGRVDSALSQENAVAVAKYALDANGQPGQRVGAWTGTLSEHNSPEQDSMSSDRADYSLVIAPTGLVR